MAAQAPRRTFHRMCWGALTMEGSASWIIGFADCSYFSAYHELCQVCGSPSGESCLDYSVRNFDTFAACTNLRKVRWRNIFFLPLIPILTGWRRISVHHHLP